MKPLFPAAGGLLIGIGAMAALGKAPAGVTSSAPNAPSPDRETEVVDVRRGSDRAGAERARRPDAAAKTSTAVPPSAAVPNDPDAGAAGHERDGKDVPTNSFSQAEGDFFSESPDPSWAPKTENAIVVIAQRFPKSRVTDVECRSRHCRVVVSSPDIETHNALFRGLAEDQDLMQGGISANLEGSDATLYIQRTES